MLEVILWVIASTVFGYMVYSFGKGFRERWEELDREAAAKRNRRKPPNTDHSGSVTLRDE